MIITFDLDGTICDSDWGWLDRVRDRGWIQSEEEKYYACREKILDPFRFLGANDEGIILTGRPVHLKRITELWLRKNGLGGLRLVFAKTFKKPIKATKKDFRRLGEDKAQFFIENNVSVHFDDNEQVVDAMREAFPHIVVIHTGYHVAW